MKLLFDQHLSFRLVQGVSKICPGSKHVKDFDLTAAGDDQIWDCALKNGLVIVTKDSDFSDRSAHLGHPPHVIWIRIGNSLSSEVLPTLLEKIPAIEKLFNDPAIGLVEVF